MTRNLKEKKEELRGAMINGLIGLIKESEIESRHLRKSMIVALKDEEEAVIGTAWELGLRLGDFVLISFRAGSDLWVHQAGIVSGEQDIPERYPVIIVLATNMPWDVWHFGSKVACDPNTIFTRIAPARLMVKRINNLIKHLVQLNVKLGYRLSAEFLEDVTKAVNETITTDS